jgi:hypothetical protein
MTHTRLVTPTNKTPPLSIHTPAGESAGDEAAGSTGNAGVVPSFEAEAPLLQHLLTTERAYVERLQGFKVCFVSDRRRAWGPASISDLRDMQMIRSIGVL